MKISHIKFCSYNFFIFENRRRDKNKGGRGDGRLGGGGEDRKHKFLRQTNFSKENEK